MKPSDVSPFNLKLTSIFGRSQKQWGRTNISKRYGERSNQMLCATCIVLDVGILDNLIEFTEHQDQADQKEQEDWVIVQNKVSLTHS